MISERRKIRKNEELDCEEGERRKLMMMRRRKRKKKKRKECDEK